MSLTKALQKKEGIRLAQKENINVKHFQTTAMQTINTMTAAEVLDLDWKVICMQSLFLKEEEINTSDSDQNK